MKRANIVRAWSIGLCVVAGLTGGGCKEHPQGAKVEEDTKEPTEAVVEAPIPEAERFSLTVASTPTAGKPSGTGFATGDAAHGGGMGTGFAGYKGIGGHGTDGAITDGHPAGPPEKTPDPVLPPQ